MVDSIRNACWCQLYSKFVCFFFEKKPHQIPNSRNGNGPVDQHFRWKCSIVFACSASYDSSGTHRFVLWKYDRLALIWHQYFARLFVRSITCVFFWASAKLCIFVEIMATKKKCFPLEPYKSNNVCVCAWDTKDTTEHAESFKFANKCPASVSLRLTRHTRRTKCTNTAQLGLYLHECGSKVGGQPQQPKHKQKSKTDC